MRDAPETKSPVARATARYHSNLWAFDSKILSTEQGNLEMLIDSFVSERLLGEAGKDGYYMRASARVTQLLQHIPKGREPEFYRALTRHRMEDSDVAENPLKFYEMIAVATPIRWIVSFLMIQGPHFFRLSEYLDDYAEEEGGEFIFTEGENSHFDAKFIDPDGKEIFTFDTSFCEYGLNAAKIAVESQFLEHLLEQEIASVCAGTYVAPTPEEEKDTE
jgi:hypothetical protein